MLCIYVVSQPVVSAFERILIFIALFRDIDTNIVTLYAQNRKLIK